MNSADRTRFATLIKDAMAFYKQDVSMFGLDVWWQACQNYDFEQVTKALTKHAMDPERGQFAPKPADIVRALSGTHTDRSLVAWGKVFDAIRSVGAYSSVAFDDPVIHSVIEDMGGWVKLCRLETDAIPFTQRRFCETYRALLNGDKRHFPAYLPGDSELHNNTLGYESPKPLLVGDPAAAENVLRLGSRVRRTAITVQSALLIGSAP